MQETLNYSGNKLGKREIQACIKTWNKMLMSCCFSWKHESPRYRSNLWDQNSPIRSVAFAQTAINTVAVSTATISRLNWALFQPQRASRPSALSWTHPLPVGAAYLCSADNCSLDNIKLAQKGEWAVMMADFMQFVMRGFCTVVCFPHYPAGPEQQEPLGSTTVLNQPESTYSMLLYIQGDIQRGAEKFL